MEQNQGEILKDLSSMMHISAPTKADFNTVGLKLKWTQGADLFHCEAEVRGGYGKFFSLLHNASTQEPTCKPSS